MAWPLRRGENVMDSGTVKPLSWREMLSYATMTGETLEADEWRIVQEMSKVYCAQIRDTSPFAVSPLEKALEND